MSVWRYDEVRRYRRKKIRCYANDFFSLRQQNSNAVVEHVIDNDSLLVDRILAYRAEQANLLKLKSGIEFDTRRQFDSVNNINQSITQSINQLINKSINQ